MKVVISSGHGKHIRGASGSPVPPQCDEVDEARKVVEQVANALRDLGVSVTTFHDDVSDDQNENLNRIVDFHNAQGSHDWDVSVHFNAYDGNAHGCEVLWVSSTGQVMAKEMVDAICEASGLTNRGAKQRTDLFFLNQTNEWAVLVETAFCDNTSDCNIYRDHFTEICDAIALSLAGEEAGERPPPVLPERPGSSEDAIMDIAMNSAIAGYNWKDRGVAPPGYIQGFALAWAQVVEGYLAGEDAAMEMGKANTHNDDKDALSWYNSNFASLGMTNEYSDIHTLRHLFVLLLGLGMRESSGKHCEGRDMSADNVSSDTAEAGLYQTSYNAHSCCDEFNVVMDDYLAGRNEGYLDVFKKGVTCDDSDWASYGSGIGKQFQDLCKSEPAFAVETCALVLRNLGGEEGHYGPIRRKEAELKREADEMLLEVQRYVEDKWVA